MSITYRISPLHYSSQSFQNIHSACHPFGRLITQRSTFNLANVRCINKLKARSLTSWEALDCSNLMNNHAIQTNFIVNRHYFSRVHQNFAQSVTLINHKRDFHSTFHHRNQQNDNCPSKEYISQDTESSHRNSYSHLIELPLEPVVEETIQRVYYQFKNDDLMAFDKSIVQLKEAVDNYFQEMGIFQLWFKGHLVQSDVNAIIRDHSLRPVEDQMTHATGRFNALKEFLLIITEQAIKSKLHRSNASQDGHTHIQLTQALEDIESLKKYTSEGQKLESYVLRDPLSELKLEKYLPTLQKQIDRLGLISATYQVSLISLCAIGIHLGIPIVLGVPFTVGASALGFVWAKNRWSSYQQSFFSGLSRTQKNVRANIENKYRNELQNSVVEPLNLVLKELFKIKSL